MKKLVYKYIINFKKFPNDNNVGKGKLTLLIVVIIIYSYDILIERLIALSCAFSAQYTN